MHRSVHDNNVTANINDWTPCLHWGWIRVAFVLFLRGNTQICKYNLTKRTLQIPSWIFLLIAKIQMFCLFRFCLHFALISAGIIDHTNKCQLANILLGRNSYFLFSFGKESMTYRRKIRSFPNILLVLMFLFDLPSTYFPSIYHFLQLTDSIQIGANLD